MKAKELMIDDLVHLYVNNDGITNEDVKVVTLCEDSITILNKFGIDEEYREDDVIDGVSAITPIPLTEEILMANGFECPFEECVFEMRSMEYSIYVCLKRHCINIQVNFREIADEAFIRVHCKYVHELQHALRLCGLNELADNFKIKEE